MESKHISNATMTSIAYSEYSKQGELEKAPDKKMDEQQWTPTRQVKLIVLGQMFVVFAISLDMTILTATLPVRTQARLRENAGLTISRRLSPMPSTPMPPRASG